jgi:hypothetical protein
MQILDKVLEGISKGEFRVVGFNLSSEEFYHIGKDLDSMDAAIEIAINEDSINNIVRIYDSDQKMRANFGTF